MDLITSDLNSQIYICTGVEAVTGLPLGIAWVIPQPARPARIEKKNQNYLRCRISILQSAYYAQRPAAAVVPRAGQAKVLVWPRFASEVMESSRNDVCRVTACLV
jgi:hypothetical protein